MIEMKCPCCGQPMSRVEDPTKIPMAPIRQTIIKALPATVEELAAAVYGSREKTPSAQYKSLRMTITHMRKLLEPRGWTISNTRPGRGRSTTYRLMRLP